MNFKYEGAINLKIKGGKWELVGYYLCKNKIHIEHTALNQTPTFIILH